MLLRASTVEAASDSDEPSDDHLASTNKNEGEETKACGTGDGRTSTYFTLTRTYGRYPRRAAAAAAAAAVLLR